jgi:hypothetical protein
MNYDHDDEALGYKRPPRWAQFKKGQSGNPGGRPRKQKGEPPTIISSSMADNVLRSEIGRVVELTEGGQRKKLEMLELVTRAQLKSAATGNHIAQRDVLRQVREMEERDAVRAEQAAQDKIRGYQNVVAWKKTRTLDWAEAQGRGDEPDPVWPHPDDIILHPKQLSFTIRGPFELSHVPQFEYYRAERDWFFATAALDRRTWKSDRRPALSVYDLWIVWDRWLPLRWQIFPRWIGTMDWYQDMPLARLHAIIDEAACRKDRLQPPPDREKDKAAYKTVNGLMKPVLKIYGFRSLAQFQAQYAAKGDTMKLVKVVPQAKS